MSDKIEIHYKRAKFGRRILANVIDFILFVLSFIFLFIASRAIMAVTPTYSENYTKMTTIQVESGLYVEVTNDNDTQIIDVVTYNTVFDLPASTKVYNSKIATRQFVNYMQINASEEEFNLLTKDIKEAALSYQFKGINVFIEDEVTHEIVKNEDVVISSETLFNEFYTPLLDNVLRSHLVTGLPEYYSLTKYMSNVLFFVEIPIALLLSGILIYFVPTLFFRKGRKTLGKAMYHIGVVDSRLLNVSFGKSVARFAIFFFLEVCLSLITLGIPIIISFTMMAFSKNRQGFPDYMLGIHEVDTSDNKIFDSYDDITLDEIKRDKKPVDFQMSRFE